MPGSRPPSARPRIVRTARKLAGLRTKPRHMVMVPQVAVSVGSQIFGVNLLMIKLDGSSLRSVVVRKS